MKRTTIIIMALLANVFLLPAQQPTSPVLELEVGKPMPDFTLTDIAHNEKQSVSLDDLKGKWLVLNVWRGYSQMGVANYAELNALKEQFDGKVEFMLVARSYDLLGWTRE